MIIVPHSNRSYGHFYNLVTNLLWHNITHNWHYWDKVCHTCLVQCKMSWKCATLNDSCLNDNSREVV